MHVPSLRHRSKSRSTTGGIPARIPAIPWRFLVQNPKPHKLVKASTCLNSLIGCFDESQNLPKQLGTLPFLPFPSPLCSLSCLGRCRPSLERCTILRGAPSMHRHAFSHTRPIELCLLRSPQSPSQVISVIHMINGGSMYHI